MGILRIIILFRIVLAGFFMSFQRKGEDINLYQHFKDSELEKVGSMIGRALEHREER